MTDIVMRMKTLPDLWPEEMKAVVRSATVKECPSPKNPCMCRCHERGAKDGTMKDWCDVCRIGKHKPKYPK